MVNSVQCTKCGNWFYGRSVKTKRVTTRLATHFVFSRCRIMIERIKNLIKKLCDEVETVHGFCCLGAS